jgi:hypothetical protein
MTGEYRTVITTAPTSRQVRELLWKEIRKAYRIASERGNPIGGYLPPSATQLRITDDWQAIGFSSDDPVNVQGWHCPGGTLVILDEAAGVHHGIWDALHGVIVGEFDRLLAIANPTEASGPFFDLFKDPGSVNISISAYDTPNVQSGRVVIPGLVTREWVEDRMTQWGNNSAMFKSRVLGEFPDDADDVLVPLSWILAANQRWHSLNNANGHGWEGYFQAGLDVARYGPDSTVMAFACSKGVKRISHFRKAATTETVGWVLRQMREDDAVTEVRVDADGLGAGVYDMIRDELGPQRVVEMRGGMSANSSEDYENRRSEWLWNLRTRLDPASKSTIALPPDDALAQQLTSIRWKITKRGLVAIESKDDMRRRGMASPDESDAVAYACADLSGQAVVVPIDPELGARPNPWRL